MKFLILLLTLFTATLFIIGCGAIDEDNTDISMLDSAQDGAMTSSNDASFTNEHQLVFRAEDFIGAKIAVITGSIFDQIIIDYIPGAEPIYFNVDADTIEVLKNNRVDAIINDDAVIRLFMAKNPDLRMLEPFITYDNYAAVVAQGQYELLNKLNEFIDLIVNEETYDDMLYRWLDSPDQPPIPYIPEGNGEVLRVGTTGIIDGFSFFKDGEITGFDIEFVKRFTSFADMTLEIVVMDVGGLIPAIQSGKIDVAASMLTITEERQQSVSFSNPYYKGGTALVVYIPTADTSSSLTFWQSIINGIERNLIHENRWKLVLDGLLVSLTITFFAFTLATLLGFGVCGLKMSKNPILRVIGNIYVTVLRGTPIVVLLMITFYVIFAKSTISGVWIAVIAFGANGAAFIGEIIRSAIQTIDKGQIEAARSMGFSTIGAFFTVTLPQAIRIAFPVYMSEFISLFKMTSVVGYIAIVDLTKAGDIIRSRTYDAFFPLIMVALIYLITASILIYIFNLINQKTNKRLRRIKR
ncbi:MAG: ABC transporter substrate-binding protein/permease [Oscillospiraceae bacterium]|jgi:polar amino acid transport system substrate-binding protein|nr:ABC transporter substrate-binding protein/permease [Oscillospiraceae bacterium]